jgi:23S rRNA (cytidine1920-2'-O)/16S rRNA (cytidine1409-2'-O)-methyltransferase
LICADLGCSTGGFTDCLLQRGAAKVYAVDTGHGVLDWKLRNHPCVVVMERTNAMHVVLPEPAQFISIDVSWTRQKNILPSARRLLAPGANVISLIKPHYEAEKSLLRKGVLPEDQVRAVFQQVSGDIERAGFEIIAVTASPITGTGGNTELLTLIRSAAARD